MALFDTLKVAYQLRDAGFEEKQADALVSAFANDIGSNLATKDDIATLRQGMASNNATLLQEMALREERMKAMVERQNARFTVLVLGLAGLLLTAIGVATGILASMM